jgi:glycosyltransferase involved in cell wall biosynthesis
VTDASILIPTYRHAALLPYALRSALDQKGATVEVLVVGDGVEDATRDVLAQFASDSRVRFFDFPKGPRHGEVSRHAALQEAQGRVVCYLSDDDLLLPGHAAEMCRLLADADFAHGPSARFTGDGELLFFPWNYGREEFVAVGRGRIGSIGLTGTAHTLEAYRRLPYGWRTTPPGMPTDHHMWLQWLDLPGLRAVRGERLTYLTFPDPDWGKLPESERAASLADWYERSREPGFADELDGLLREAIRRAAEDYHLWARREQLGLEAVHATRTWRLRDRLLGLRPLRALLGRRRGAR